MKNKYILIIKSSAYLIAAAVIFTVIWQLSYFYSRLLHLDKQQITELLTQHTTYQIKLSNLQTNWRAWKVRFTTDHINITSLQHQQILTAHNARLDIDPIILLSTGKLRITNLSAEKLSSNIDNIPKINHITGSITITPSTKGTPGSIQANNEISIANIQSIVHTTATISQSKIAVDNIVIKNYKTNINDLLKIIPTHLILKELYHWLQSSIKTGIIEESTFKLDSSNNISWQANIEHAKLQYASDWPPIENIFATLKLNNQKLNISTKQATIVNTPVTHLVAEYPVNQNIHITGNITANTAQGLTFLGNSPLKGIQQQLKPLNPKGKFDLTLTVTVPLKKAITVTGDLQLKKNTLTMLNTEINNINGTLHFGNNYLTGKKLKMKILGSAAKADVIFDNTKQQPATIKINSKLNSKKLAAYFPKIAYLASGSTNYQLDFIMPTKTSTSKTIFATNLQGMQVNLPGKFAKESDVQRQLQITYTNGKPATLQANYGSLADSNLKITDGNPTNGYIRFGNTTKQIDNQPQDHILLIGEKFNGKLSALDINKGRYDFTFDTLHLPEKGTNTFDDTLKFIVLPQILFKCKACHLGNKNLGEISTNLININDSYIIENFTMKNQTMQLSAKGKWRIKNNHATSISGNIESNDFGSSLDSLGYSNIIDGGKGTINMQLEWLDDPLNFKLANATGDLNIDIQTGSIISVDPGFGRIIGLLSLESIQRRLQLNFNDILKKGFAFNQLQGNLKLSNSMLEVNSADINGLSANIHLTGTANLTNKNIEMLMKISNKASATLPVAAALAAGNPAVGAVLWLFDQVSSPKTSEADNYNYKVSGNWDKPEITELKQ